jgi:hypothetical protein
MPNGTKGGYLEYGVTRFKGYRLRFFLDFRITWASTGRPDLFSFTRMGMNFPAGSLKLLAGFRFELHFRFLAIG